MYMRLVCWFGRLLRDGSEMELWFGDACVCVCVLGAGNSGAIEEAWVSGGGGWIVQTDFAGSVDKARS